MDIRKVKKLIELLDDSGIAEIEITEGEESVRISRYATSVPAMAAPAVAAAPAPAAASASPAPAPVATTPDVVEEDGYDVTAPMVGTFYSSSSPGAAPYVQVGDRVSEGDTLCIIEAMKMRHPIEADVSGVVRSLRTQNGEPVEYGQVLFVIDQRED